MNTKTEELKSFESLKRLLKDSKKMGKCEILVNEKNITQLVKLQNNLAKMYPVVNKQGVHFQEELISQALVNQSCFDYNAISANCINILFKTLPGFYDEIFFKNRFYKKCFEKKEEDKLIMVVYESSEVFKKECLLFSDLWMFLAKQPQADTLEEIFKF